MSLFSKGTPKGYPVVRENEASKNPYPYIYVNADGSARELYKDERQYLETPFPPSDGGRPYIKSSYSQKNGWGKIDGFLQRSKIPHGTIVSAAPTENRNTTFTKERQIQLLRDNGFEVVENSDGFISASRIKLDK